MQTIEEWNSPDNLEDTLWSVFFYSFQNQEFRLIIA